MIFEQKERTFRRQISVAVALATAHKRALSENAPKRSTKCLISAILMVVLGKKVDREGQR